MKELDNARQRILDKKQAAIDRAEALPKNLDLIKGPVLDMEAWFLGSVSDTITPLLQEAKSEIEKTEGFVVNVQVNFDFKYRDSKYIKFVHKVWKEGSTPGEVWKRMHREFVKSEPFYDSYGRPDGSWDTYCWKEEDKLPEELIDGAMSDSSWINKNIVLERANFALYNNEHKCFLYIDVKDINSNASLTLKGPSDITYPTKENMDKEAIDSMAEELIDMLDKKKYLEKDEQKVVKDDSSIQEVVNPPLSTLTEEVSESPKSINNNLIDQINQDQYRAVQEDEKDRVLAHIEEIENSDPNYHRPSWISADERSRRSLNGSYLDEREQFLNDDAFDTALQRHFPKPWENG